MTLKRSNHFSTPVGDFEYVRAQKDYFNIGIRQEITDQQYAYLIATPEKALCDMVVTLHGHRIQSLKAMKVFMEEDLRVDFSAVENYNPEIVKACAETRVKKMELNWLYKLLSLYE